MTNTKLWEQQHNFQSEISQIEKKLSQYCYKY